MFKTLWQKQKLIVLSNFSICHNVCKNCMLPLLCVNPFPHIDAFWRLCSRQLFKNKVTKEEIAENEQFFLLPQCFLLLVIGHPFNYRNFLFFDKNCSKLSAAETPYEVDPLFLLKNIISDTAAGHKLIKIHIILKHFLLEDTFWHICSRRIYKTLYK